MLGKSNIQCKINKHVITGWAITPWLYVVIKYSKNIIGAQNMGKVRPLVTCYCKNPIGAQSMILSFQLP